MKTIVGVASVIASFISLTAFGQGYAYFSGVKGTVWDGFTMPTIAQRTSNVNVSFLWGQQGSMPVVESILGGGVPTNTTFLNATYSPYLAWSDILSDPDFTLAMNANSGLAVVTRTTTAGAFAYNSGAGFQLVGTSPGNSYTLFVIGWDANYATPNLAAAAGAAVGWSTAFDYTVTTFTAIPNSMTVTAFGTAGVPEPAALAVGGLAGLLLCWRRRRA